ncbi:MAG: M28 family peptidase [Pedobacter sp.]|nr:MAG: M28 family peptidase [Pedobacter sp.]
MSARNYSLIILLLCVNILNAQDLVKTRKILDTLTSKTMWGRGYTNNGLTSAANYIVNEFKAYGLTPLDGESYKQEFLFSVNTFPNHMSVAINSKSLSPGKDFVVLPESKGQVVSANLKQTDSNTYVDASTKVVVVLKDKLTWSVAQKPEEYTGIAVLKTEVQGKLEKAEINISNTHLKDFAASNIYGSIKGTTKPDSLIVFTAHYDHLGGMGKDTYFPGANDNGSGITLLLQLAAHYAKNPQRYSMVFICFAAEEAGLLGSKYFTENPPLPLSHIRFLINTDMVGTGDTGITVVNATEHPKEFALLNQINNKNRWLPKINSRGKAANSDHYYFTEKGVPAFFIYTTGGIAAYHDIYDKAVTLPLTKFAELFKLIVAFNTELTK